jgi:hypothetical protein
MPLVGFTTFFAADDEIGYRPANDKPGTFIFIYPATTALAGGRAPTRSWSTAPNVLDWPLGKNCRWTSHPADTPSKHGLTGRGVSAWM